MYQSLLTRKYLFSKVMPLLASLSVMLCTAMVLITWSVMGGFSTQLFSIGRSMIGDVTIAWPVIGIPHYEALIKTLEADPMVEAATPTIEAMGLLAIPPPPGSSVVEPRTVQVIGVEPEGYDKVTGFYDRIWWKHLAKPLPHDTDKLDQRLIIPEVSQIELDGRTLTKPDPKTGVPRPAIVVGTQVTKYNQRTREGYINPPYPAMFAPNLEPTISVLPLSAKNVVIELQSRALPIANEFYSGLYESDANWIIMPLNILQKMLKLDAAQKTDPNDKGGTIVRDPATGRETIRPPKVIGVEPARATNILVKAKPGITPDQLRERVRQIYDTFSADPARIKVMPPSDRVLIFTWEHKPGLETFIAAVKHETVMVLVIFSFISLTAVFLVLSIFWSMVAEKTKDIGVLRAMGASGLGVAWLWVRYGLIIGVVGSILGGIVTYLVINNINAIHEWLGAKLGIVIWDPSVYYFTEIPARVNPLHAAIVLSGGILWCALGAFVPAFRAARMDPVKALRFE